MRAHDLPAAGRGAPGGVTGRATDHFRDGGGRCARRGRAARVPLLGVLCCLLFAPHAFSRAQPAGDLAAAREAASRLPRLHSLLVSHQGRLVLEHYRRDIRPSRPANVKSVSKSVLAALVGIAIDRKVIPSVRTPITTYFPELRTDPDARKHRITVEDLLTMRSGLESTSFRGYGAWVGSRNWVRYVLSLPVRHDPGTVMDYSTGNSHLLSAILTKAAKRSTLEFARDVLARPLGFTLAPWPRDPQGIYFGGNDMLLTPRQMVSFGELFLRDGRAGDRQIVPEAWVDTSCEGRGRSRFNPDQEYGYGWWRREFAGRTACFAWGFGGQYIFVLRDLDLVVVTTSASDVSDERRDHRRGIFDILERHLVPAFEEAGSS